MTRLLPCNTPGIDIELVDSLSLLWKAMSGAGCDVFDVEGFVDRNIGGVG